MKRSRGAFCIILILLGAVSLLTSCTAVSSASRMNALQEIVLESGGADSNLSESIAHNADDLQVAGGYLDNHAQPEAYDAFEDSVLSAQMQELMQNGLRVLDQRGNTAALIKRFSEAESYGNAKDGIMVILNVSGSAVEYFPTDAGGAEEYFQKYAATDKYAGPEYSSFQESDMQILSVQCVSTLEPLKESSLSGWWKRYVYRTGGRRFAEYFCAIPYQSIGSSGMISVHMRMPLSMSDPENQSDDLFLHAAGSVVPFMGKTDD